MSSSGGYEQWRENLRRYIDAGVALSKLSRKELEAIAREMTRGGGSGAEVVEDFVEEVRARSRRGLDVLSDLMRHGALNDVENFAGARREEMTEVFNHLVGLVGDFFGGAGGKTPSSEPQGSATVTPIRPRDGRPDEHAPARPAAPAKKAAKKATKAAKNAPKAAGKKAARKATKAAKATKATKATKIAKKASPRPPAKQAGAKKLSAQKSTPRRTGERGPR